MKKNAAPPEPSPADAAGFERFQAELLRLVAQFEKNFKQYQSAAYDEASVRQEFLNPLFRALGWDVENKLGHIPQHREVEIESRTQVSGRQKRADCPADRSHGARIHAQGIAGVVQADRMRDLGEQQRHNLLHWVNAWLWASTPNSLARWETKWPGIRLHSCLRMVYA